MTTTTEQKLTRLHDLLCDRLTELLANPEITASELNVIRQFLKDNNIDALPRDDSPLGEVLKGLPQEFFNREAH